MLVFVVLYLPGPGVFAKSSEKPPVFALPDMEKDADDVLLGTRGPIRFGRVYEFGDGVESPEIYKLDIQQQ